MLVAGCGGGDDPVQSVAAAPPAGTTTKAEVRSDASRAVAAAPSGDVARPVRVRIPELNIDAALDPLHLDAKQVLVPPEYGRAGWYEDGPEPGEAGRAVVAGHVDSKTGPDVFAALHRARKGDRILVKLADGSTVRFAVDRVETHAQDDFPTAQVYGGPRQRAELRLITCTGAYVGGRYQDNLIVFATRIR